MKKVRSFRRRSPLPILADDFNKFDFHYERENAMFKKILLAVFCTLTVLGGQSVMGQTSVRGYTRSNGTYVAPHYRSSPDGNFANNWSTKGNINPYTGNVGTRVTPPHSAGFSFPSYGLPSTSPTYSPNTIYPSSQSISPSYGLPR